MTRMKRRHFLQGAGAALATIGISQRDIIRQGNRYGKALAQGTPGRKLALLVGINGYQDSPLSGCVNDVLMQRNLLIHRFGFNPDDIRILSDDRQISQDMPTRKNILKYFQSHLGQAKEGDVVVFHFSGHGSRVYDPTVAEDKLNSTFVPIDRQKVQKGDRTIVNDIMGETLFLLMYRLKTNNVTVVLDSCHSGGGKRGDALIRTIGGGLDFDPSKDERNFQRQLRGRMTDAELIQLRRDVAKGVVISSAGRDQLAADQKFEGFSAGAFTYALTQYLWQATSNDSVETAIVPVRRTTTRLSSQGQVPEFEAKKNTDNHRKPVYFLEKQMPPAEAVTLETRGDQIQLWLGGVAPRSLAAFGVGSTFTMLNAQGNPIGKVQLESRKGLEGTAKLLGGARGAAPGGILLQEDVRAIPKELPMRIGLDRSLTAEEKRVATQTLPKLGSLIPIELLPSASVGVEYILGRVTRESLRDFQAQKDVVVPELGSLYLAGQSAELIPGSAGQANESIAEGLTRLGPKFRALLAARLLRLTLNAESSRLKINAKMTALDGSSTEVVAGAFTPRGGIEKQQGAIPKPKGKVRIVNGIPQVPKGTQVRFEIQNQEERDLYVTVLVISAEGEIGLLFPNQYKSDIESARVSAGEKRFLPDPQKGDAFELVSKEASGRSEVLIVASTQPLREALKVTAEFAKQQGTRGGEGLSLQKPMEFVEQLLGDLDRGSRGARMPFEIRKTQQVASAAQIAAVSITFESVEA